MSRPLRISLHVGYWIAVLLFYVLYFGARPDRYGQNILFAALLLPITIGTTYFILYRLIPRYLLRRRYWMFGLYLLYTFIVSFYLELVLVVGLYMTVSDYQAMVVEPDFPSLLDAILGMYLFVSIAVVAYLSQRTLETNLRLKEAELQLLKSRIHPHFLFNALNSLYALALERSQETPELILRLSTLLDYVLHKAEQDRVPLSDELDMIRSYVELESVRCSDRADVTIDISGHTRDLEIAPLLLIPLVENAFKHGVHPTRAPSWIRIVISVDDELDVSVTNSVPDPTDVSSRAPASEESAIDQSLHNRHGGFGLHNLRQRLDHAYAGAYTLTIDRTDDHCDAHLTVQLR